MEPFELPIFLERIRKHNNRETISYSGFLGYFIFVAILFCLTGLATMAHHFASAAGLEKQSSRKDRKLGNDQSTEESFLRVHTPDRGQKSLLDPADVYEALKLQAESIMRKEGSLPDPSEASEWWDVRSNSEADAGSMFDFAQSEVTTGTSATMQMGNVARYRASKEFNIPAFINEEEDDDDANSIKIPNRSPLKGNHKFGSAEENMNTARNNLQRMHENRVQTAGRKIKDALLPKVLTACVAPKELTSCVAPKEPIEPKDEIQIKREEYMSVLRLKMKAHLGTYYVNRYLPMFPEATAYHGAKVKTNEMPHLTSDDSEGSSSSGIVEYTTTPPQTSVICSITDSIFMDLAVTGSLGLVPRNSHQPRKAPRPNQKSPDHYLVLVNRRSGVPIAVCALKSEQGMPIVRIYATKPRVYGQLPAATTKKLGLDWSCSWPLYAWAEIVTEGLYPDPVHFSVYMASGSKGQFSKEPTYRADFTKEESPRIRMVGRTEKERRESGCAIISIDLDGGKEYDDASFQIDVSQGIDPALLICFTAVVDEVLEKSMRLKVCSHRIARACNRA